MKQETTSKAYRIFLSLTIVFAALTVICLVAGFFTKDNAYRSWTGISAATDVDTRTKSYIRAINLCPEKTDAYILLLDCYSEDGVFSKAESEKFLSLYNANHKRLQTRDSNYAKLHYRAGFLYANGYDETSTARLRMAKPFFEAAMSSITEDDENLLAVTSYSKICQYYQDYIWDAAAVREVSPEEMTSLVADIKTMVLAYLEDTSPDSIYNSLGYYEAVCNLFYSQRDVLAATVPEESVQEILSLIYDNLPDGTNLQKEQVRLRLKDLTANHEMYTDMIGRAYGRKDGAEDAS